MDPYDIALEACTANVSKHPSTHLGDMLGMKPMPDYNKTVNVTKKLVMKPSMTFSL